MGPDQADALDEIGLVDHRVQRLAGLHQGGAGDLAHAAEVLLVPEQVVVEEQLGRKSLDQLAVGVDEQLPVTVELVDAAHPLGELVRVGAALGELN